MQLALPALGQHWDVFRYRLARWARATRTGANILRYINDNNPVLPADPCGQNERLEGNGKCLKRVTERHMVV